ncbi:hypothetical protein, partial [Caminibacter pacificus]
DEFHQNIGILQTANNALDTILTYVDMLKNINNPTQDVLKEIADEINSVTNNTTFDNLNVFSQTINIGDDKLNLSIPAFTPDTDIEKYEELLLKQKDNIFSALQNLSITTPLSTQNVNPVDFETFTSLLSSGTLLNAYNTELINPQTLELLL